MTMFTINRLNKFQSPLILSATTDIRVRFSEVDMMGVVWHGHYAKFFEDGRADFARKYELNYLDLVGAGLTAPVVKMNVNYKKPLHYDQPAYIETIFKDSRAARLEYKYRIYTHETRELITEGSTLQVFVNSRGQLMLSIPEPFILWKTKWGVIE